jgi:hypothetical protein
MAFADDYMNGKRRALFRMNFAFNLFLSNSHGPHLGGIISILPIMVAYQPGSENQTAALFRASPAAKRCTGNLPSGAGLMPA